MTQQGSETGKLDPGSSHRWEGPYNNLSIRWYTEGPWEGTLQVHIRGDKESVRYAIPNPRIHITGPGVIFNDAYRSIVFTLSNNPIPDNPITDNTRP